jgi:hypothetical protein
MSLCACSAARSGSGSTASGVTADASEKAAETRAERVERCETTHGLHQALETRKTGEGSAYERSTYDWFSCTWPASTDAEPDGFTHIHVDVLEGPGVWRDGDRDTSEASDANTRDVITGPCTVYTVTYDYGHMGAMRHGVPTNLPRGLVTSIDHLGRHWSPPANDPSGWTFYPGRDEVDVIRNDNYIPAMITCSERSA